MSDFFDHEEDDERYDDEGFDEEPDEFDEDDDSEFGGLGAEAAIQRAIAEIERAKGLPLSSSVMVQRADLLDLLHQALDALPHELAEAQQVLRDAEALKDAKIREGERVFEDVQARAQMMVSKTEIVRMSQRRADEIIEEANEAARQRRLETDEFIERKLAKMEIVVNRILKTVLAGREKLAPAVENGQTTLASDDLGDDDDSGSFFDQELQ
jgi:hypothetical protein